MALILNNIEVEYRKSDNYVNATQMCKAGGKLFAEWKRLSSTKALIEALEIELNNHIKSDMLNPISHILAIDVKKGNSELFSQGSWIHPDLAVQLAQWISPMFALKVSKWIRELISTGSVSIDTNKTDEELVRLQNENAEKSKLLEQQKKEAEEQAKLIEQQKKEMDEHMAKLNRAHNINIELLTFKKRITKNEIVYIVSTAAYARQGIFKIGMTRNAMKFRSSSHNTTHIAGDKIKVIHEFKVNDCAQVERNIHNKLSGLLLEGEKEFFMCPYNLLKLLVDKIVKNDEDENAEVASIVDEVYVLRNKEFSSADWIKGIPDDIFPNEEQQDENTIKIQIGRQAPIKLKISDWSDEQKQIFVLNCIAIYDKQNAQENARIIWKDFQQYIINELVDKGIAKSNFKPTEWRNIVESEAKNNNREVVWVRR